MPARRPNKRPSRRGLFERLEPRLPLAADITTGLVHHWTFDETSGNTAADSAGDSDGALINWNATEPKWEPGRVGGALRFGSGDNHVLAPQLPASGSYSVSFWLNVAERNAIHPRILNSRIGNTVYINNETNLGVSFSANETSNTFSPSPPTFNAWEHYAINFNATTGQGVIYRSGAPVAIGAFIDTASLPNWTIGHHFDITNHDQSLRGALDDLRVYNRLLTDEDIAALASLGTPEPTHQEPVHHWTFDETTGFTARDIAGDADGTLLNWSPTEPRWEPGKVGGALRFSTVDNAVVTAPASVGATWSVAFWANVTARDSLNPRVIGPDDGRELWAYFDNENGGGGAFMSHEIRTYEANPPPLNTWQHYVFTYDTLADIGKIYRNGRLVASGVFHDNPVKQAWVFGHNRDLGNHNESLNGLLDDLRVYDRLLSTTEIQTLALVALSDAYTINEDLLLDVAAAQGLLANDTNAAPGSKTTVETQPPHGTLELNEDGSFTYDPHNDYNGPDTFTYRLTDPDDNFVVATVALTIRPVNDAPTFTKGPDLTATDEQFIVSGPRTITFGGLKGQNGALFQSPYAEHEFIVTPGAGRWIESHIPVLGNPIPAIYGDTFTATLEVTRPTGTFFSFAGFDLASWDGLTPIDPVEYQVDGLLGGQIVFSASGQVATEAFAAIPSPSAAIIDTLRFSMVRNDTQAYVLDNINLVIPPSVIIDDWATNVAAGPPTATDEAAQSLQFTVTNDREDLFHDQPTIDAAGRLTFTPAPNVSGKAKITVTLRDSGGTAQSGLNSSAPQTFEITITKPHKYHNAVNRLDTDTDLVITASDVLDVINIQNVFGSQPTSFYSTVGFPISSYFDVTRDNWLAPDDILEGINWLNAFGATLAPTFLGADTTTQGNWLTRYGAEGYALNSGPSNLPAYATMSFTGGLTDIYDYVNAASTTDPRALQTPDGSDRFAAEWTGDYGFTLDLNLQINFFEPRRVSLYMLDWQPAGRWQRLDVLDGNTGELLDTRAIESFGNGVYLTFLLRGHVKIRFSNLANGLNTVLSGIFFDE